MSWNSGAQRTKQYRANEVIGRHFSLFYEPDANARGWPQKELVRAAALGRYEDEGWRPRKDGTKFWANVVITALRRDETGELRGSIAAVTGFGNDEDRRRTQAAGFDAHLTKPVDFAALQAFMTSAQLRRAGHPVSLSS